MSKANIARVEALWGALIADALSMPVHWFYNPHDIKRLCGGWIQRYIAPPPKHPTCILTLSATDSSGRKGDSPGKPVIGNIILHDKLKYWQGHDRSVHYHQGMSAGDNTLNPVLAVRIMDVLTTQDPDHKKPIEDLYEAVFENYVSFMTTPGTHNDTYADSWHRCLFRDWSELQSPPTNGSALLAFLKDRSRRMVAGPPDSQLGAIGALVCAVPWVAHYATEDEARATEAAVGFVRLTHPVKDQDSFVELFVRSLHRVMNGASLKEVAREALTSKPLNMSASKIEDLVAEVSDHNAGSELELRAYQDVVAELGMACYMKGALCNVFFLAHQFADNFQAGVLMNTNVGGENCGRGVALGALLGAATVYQSSNKIPEDLKSGLHSIASEWQRVQTGL